MITLFSKALLITSRFNFDIIFYKDPLLKRKHLFRKDNITCCMD
ncbi:MAG: hypothetical protein QG646_2417 [Euryarchaeota archaeon]|nr:hypothetical protein [Euryarchaeota archaeon]